jgi:DNA-binding helix-hairpin-helix protein with protein kinase domain
MFVTLADGKVIECDDQPFSEGGEGKIYWDKAGTHVIKLYKNVEPTREATLNQIVGPYNVVKDEAYWRKLFAWPDSIIKKPSLGITMPRVHGKDMLWFLFPRPRAVYAKEHGEDKLGNWNNYIRVAIKMSMVVSRMHKKGLCHSDLSFKNFLCEPVTNSVVLLDCDSLVIPKMIPPKVLGTPMCMAPELMAQMTGGASIEPTWRTDLHALATLIYWLLLLRHPLLGPKQHHQDPQISEALALGANALFIEDSKDISNHRKEDTPNLSYTALLPPAVAELVRQAFVDGLHNADKRPTAAVWIQSLQRMLDEIVPCNNPKCHRGATVVYPNQRGLPRCTCNQPINAPPVIPIFYFHRPVSGRVGQFLPDQGYYLVGWPGRTLHDWHAIPNDPGPETDESPKARLDYDANNHKWYLTNLDFPELYLLDKYKGRYDIRQKQRVEIQHDMRLLFGPPRETRLAHIQMKTMN